MKKFIEYLKENNWNIERVDKLSDSETLKSRYKNIPYEWYEFIKDYSLIVNEEDNVWFLCLRDYDDTDASFKYNEFELMSLDYADEEEQKNIIDFWNTNMPIIMSVKNGYEYYAINIVDGSIIHGFEPEFEECEQVATSFKEFTDKVMKKEIEL